MIVIENAGLIEGDATSAAEVDFTLHGLDNNALKQLADGQLASSKGTIYTANSTDVITAIILVNTGAAHNHVNLYLKPTGGTSRRLIPKDLQLESGYSLHFDGSKVMVMDAAGGIIYGQNVSDTAYAASWDGVTAVAPSKNAVYDKVQTLMALTGSNLAVGSDADGDMYYRAASVLARLAKDAANTKLFMNAGATAPEWAAGISITNHTPNQAALTGDVGFTGAGFKPAAAIFIHSTDTAYSYSIGAAWGSVQFNLADMNAWTGNQTKISATSLIQLYGSATNYNTGAWKSWDADGATLTFTKTGTPVANTQLSIMWFR